MNEVERCREANTSLQPGQCCPTLVPFNMQLSICSTTPRPAKPASHHCLPALPSHTSPSRSGCDTTLPPTLPHRGTKQHAIAQTTLCNTTQAPAAVQPAKRSFCCLSARTWAVQIDGLTLQHHHIRADTKAQNSCDSLGLPHWQP